MLSKSLKDGRNSFTKMFAQGKIFPSRWAKHSIPVKHTLSGSRKCLRYSHHAGPKRGKGLFTHTAASVLTTIPTHDIYYLLPNLFIVRFHKRPPSPILSENRRKKHPTSMYLCKFFKQEGSLMFYDANYQQLSMFGVVHVVVSTEQNGVLPLTWPGLPLNGRPPFHKRAPHICYPLV